jgi:periplasmic divalent cation tolerance protein
MVPSETAMGHELVLLVTAPNVEEGRRIAASLVAERLAACVNIIEGVESIYRWEGEVTTDRETLLIIKSSDDRYDDLERRVKELHAYTVPEVVALRIEKGSLDYLKWLKDSTTDVDSEE